MKNFKYINFIFYFLFFILFSACNSSENQSLKSLKGDIKSCPKCNMEVPSSHIHTSKMSLNNNNYYFDDIGCMILYSSQNSINLTKVNAKVFSNDTKQYIDAFKANYMINEHTPMMYGFSAYELAKKGSIDFKEVIIKMLRGEHMANPKIRKQILGT